MPNKAQELREEARKHLKKGRKILDEYDDGVIPQEKNNQVEKHFDKCEELRDKADDLEEKTGRADELEKSLGEPQRRKFSTGNDQELRGNDASVKVYGENGQLITRKWLNFDDETKHQVLKNQQSSGAQKERPATKAHRAAFESYMRNKQLTSLEKTMLKDLDSLTDPAGGHTVPDNMRNEVIRKLDDILYFRDMARTFQMSAKNDEFPTVESKVDADWTLEGATIPKDSDKPFGKTSFTAKSIKVIVKVSEELLEDSSMDLAGLIQREAARRFAEIEEIGFISGSGSGEPLGILNANTLTNGLGSGSNHEIVLGDFSKYYIGTKRNMSMKILDQLYAEDGKIGYRFWHRVDGSPVDQDAFVYGAGDSLASDDIYDHSYTLKKQYRQNAAWLMHRNSVKAVRKLQDSNNQYIWQPGLSAGEPATLNALPIMESEHMPDPEA